MQVLSAPSSALRARSAQKPLWLLDELPVARGFLCDPLSQGPHLTNLRAQLRAQPVVSVAKWAGRALRKVSARSPRRVTEQPAIRPQQRGRFQAKVALTCCQFVEIKGDAHSLGIEVAQRLVS